MRRQREAGAALVALLILGALAYWFGAREEAAPREAASPSAAASASRAGPDTPPPPKPSLAPASETPTPSPRPQQSPRVQPSASARSAQGEVFGDVSCAGRAVPGARVQLQVWPRAGEPALAAEVFADRAGRYRFRLPPGDWGQVRAWTQLSLEGVLQWGEARAQVSDQPLDLVLEGWAGVRLVPVHEQPVDGQPVQELGVELWSETPLGWVSLGSMGAERFSDPLDGPLVGVAFQEEPPSYWFGRAQEGVLRLEEIGAAELRVKVRDSRGAPLPCAIALSLSGHPPLQLQSGRAVGDRPGYSERAGALLRDVEALTTSGEAVWQVPPGFEARVLALAVGPKGDWRVRRAARSLTLKRGERRTVELTLEEGLLACLELGELVAQGRLRAWAHVPPGVALSFEGDSVLLSGLVPGERAWIEAIQAAPSEAGPVLVGRVELRAGQTEVLRLGEPGRVILENVSELGEDYALVPQLEAGQRRYVTYLGLEGGEASWEPNELPRWLVEWSPAGPGQFALDLPPGRYHLLGASEERLRGLEVRSGGAVRVDCRPFASIPR